MTVHNVLWPTHEYGLRLGLSKPQPKATNIFMSLFSHPCFKSHQLPKMSHFHAGNRYLDLYDWGTCLPNFPVLRAGKYIKGTSTNMVILFLKCFPQSSPFIQLILLSTLIEQTKSVACNVRSNPFCLVFLRMLIPDYNQTNAACGKQFYNA